MIGLHITHIKIYEKFGKDDKSNVSSADDTKFNCTFVLNFLSSKQTLPYRSAVKKLFLSFVDDSILKRIGGVDGISSPFKRKYDSKKRQKKMYPSNGLT